MQGPDGKPTHDTFALKVQPSSSSHNNEVIAFTYFQNNPSAYIIGFYGSFIQSGRHCLILEHADGGNLLSYLHRTPPPLEPRDRLQFWKSYSGFLKGVYRVHQVTQSVDDGDVRGWVHLPSLVDPVTNSSLRLHGDIKPDNMLLKMGPSGSPYDFIPKIADFGYSHFRSVKTNGRDKRGLDRHGNQQYCTYLQGQSFHA